MRTRAKQLAALLLAAFVLAAVLAALNTGGRPPADLPHSGVVTRIYDGDTVEVSGFGKVRLIGVDALDAHNVEKMASQSQRLGLTQKRVVEWAERAEDFARRRLLHRRVRLEFGPELRDDYGRTLAYVYLRASNGKGAANFNEALLSNGLAVAYRGFEHPLLQGFVKAEQDARRARIGLWRDARVGK